MAPAYRLPPTVSPGALIARSSRCPRPKFPAASPLPKSKATPVRPHRPGDAPVQSWLRRPASPDRDPYRTVTAPLFPKPPTRREEPMARSSYRPRPKLPAARKLPSLAAYPAAAPFTPGLSRFHSWLPSEERPSEEPYRTRTVPPPAPFSGAETARSSSGPRPKFPAASSSPRSSPIEGFPRIPGDAESHTWLPVLVRPSGDPYRT